MLKNIPIVAGINYSKPNQYNRCRTKWREVTTWIFLGFCKLHIFVVLSVHFHQLVLTFTFRRTIYHHDVYGSANIRFCQWVLSSLRPSDTYMRQWSNHHWFRWWLVAWLATINYLNKCWNIIWLHRSFKNKFQWNHDQIHKFLFKKCRLQNYGHLVSASIC